MFQSRIEAAPAVSDRPWRLPARCLLVLVLALSAWSFALYAGPQPIVVTPREEITDGALYKAIAARVAHGESYYVAAPAEHRARNFPLRPAVTVRPPLLAEVTAVVGGPIVMGWLLRLTALATFLAFVMRFSATVEGPRTRMAAIVLAALSIYVLTPIELALYHDIWAGMLVALALALRRPGHWAASIVVATVAVILRELVAPLMIVMIFSALIERRWKEAAAWTAALTLAGAVLAVHWMRVAALPNTEHMVSPGWYRALGWPWVVHTYSMTSLLAFLPTAIGVALVPVAMLGWATVERSLALRVSLWTIGMACLFMVFGRTENYYWGALVAPILPIGLAFAPGALARLWKQAR